MHKFVRNLITEWRRLGLPFGDAGIVVAVSGGADSVSLLLALHDLRERGKINLDFVVAHFDHGIRGAESRADADFVRDLAERLGFEFRLEKGRLPKTGNLEENARKARYAFLERAAKKHKAAFVLTGHTMDDQAETVLLNLIRGSGPDGLAGMQPVRELTDAAQLARPLLSWARREDTEAFCRSSQTEYRHDPMNDDRSFSRVRIRKELIPLLKTYNPKIVETLARSSLLFERPTQGGEPAETIKLLEISELERPDRFQVLRTWLGSRRGTLRSISLKHIESIDRLVNSRKSGREVELPGGGRVVKRSGRLVFEANKG